MKFLVLNGPNLNLLGIREPDIYGTQTLSALETMVRDYCLKKGVHTDFYQSNHEGGLVDRIQAAYNAYDGIILNPAAYTHTSIAIPDALRAVGIPTVEVHLSDIHAREAYRNISYTSEACIATIAGRGFQGYLDAADLLLEKLS
jgi:3-dehydroquinate dehydratase-2